jgi:hypothetical protein
MAQVGRPGSEPDVEVGYTTVKVRAEAGIARYSRFHLAGHLAGDTTGRSGHEGKALNGLEPEAWNLMLQVPRHEQSSNDIFQVPASMLVPPRRRSPKTIGS